MATGAILSRPIQYRPSGSVYTGRRRAGVKTRSASQRTDTRAFLNQRIDNMPLYGSPMKKVYSDGLCGQLIAGCERLFEFSGDKFPISEEFSVENMLRVINDMERWAASHELSLVATKNADDDIGFTLYREERELELKVFYFFISPADSLPEDLAALYRRFICFTAASLGIRVMPYHSDNRYLDMMINSNEWYDEDDEPEYYTLYNSEAIGKKFEAVCDAKIDHLGEDLLKYRKGCEPKYLDLVELMIEGMEILPTMCTYNYDFNPYRDGFEESDGEIELMSTLAILYSSNDGMEDALMETINNDSYCGLVPQGWNRWLILSPDMKREDYEALTDKNDYPKRFLDWSGRFYDESVKFDNYNKEKV